jgi:hypothetical protein
MRLQGLNQCFGFGGMPPPCPQQRVRFGGENASVAQPVGDTVSFGIKRALAEKKFALIDAMKKGAIGMQGPDSQALNPFSGSSQGIELKNWPMSIVTNLDETVCTRDMRGCAALIGVNRAANKQYLVHVPYDLPVVALKRDITQKIGTEGTQFSLVPGQFSMTRATTWNILSALGELDPKSLDSLKFRHFPESASTDEMHHLSVVVQNGDLTYGEGNAYAATGGRFIPFTEEEGEAHLATGVAKKIEAELGRPAY